MYTIRPIRSEEDYEAALARIRELMGAQRNTPEGDELDVLTDLVEHYEDKQYPVDKPTAVNAIEFRMDQAGLTRRDLIPLIGSRQKVSDVLTGKRDITISMARALHKHLGIPADILLQEPGAAFDSTFDEIDPHRFPLKEMAKRNWFPELTKLPEPPNLLDRAKELINALLQKAGGPQAAALPLYRKNAHRRLNAKTDPYALKAWCWRVLALANESPPQAPYRPGTVTEPFMRQVAQLSVHEDGPRRARQRLAEHGIALVIERHLPRTHLDGAALCLLDGRPVIGLTLRYDRIDNFWFSLMHELAHVSLHLDCDENELFIDDLSLTGEAPLEKEADTLAQNALIPPQLWHDSPVRQRATILAAYTFARQINVHPAIIAGRIRHDRANYRLLSQLVGSGQVRRQFEECHDN
ncbi:MAG: ImmA/IrrE family metallo-endopeptidase [Caldilineaceae bacterium SB0668_bin_21]|nr:ImmA/IrrE family metallo-endopeptidase [Caldilineaceae bacterium SB0668_bin_21]